MKNLIFFFIFIVASCNNSKKSKIENTNNKIKGIDVSHYQGKINWDKVLKDNPEIKFVIIRATMGEDRKDDLYEYNIQELRNKSVIVGIYHYYDPDEYSLTQAKNYCSIISLKKGDFIPIVDIEVPSKIQSMNSLKLGLQRYLDMIEKHYKHKPIIYTGKSFWEDNLKEDFPKYSFWIAAYDPKHYEEILEISFLEENENPLILILQFSRKETINGIKTLVDGNYILEKNLPKLLMTNSKPKK